MEVETIGSVLLKISEDLDSLTSNAKVLVDKDVNNFVNGKLGSNFGPAIKLYAELFKSIGVKSRTELEDEIKKNFKHHQGWCLYNYEQSTNSLSVRDAFEGLLESETSWNELVGSLDMHLSKSQNTKELNLGEVCGEEIGLIDARLEFSCIIYVRLFAKFFNDQVGSCNFPFIPP